MIHDVKGGKITIIAREKKRELCWYPFAGKHDWKDRWKGS